MTKTLGWVLGGVVCALSLGCGESNEQQMPALNATREF
jgi:hypothetical protein